MVGVRDHHDPAEQAAGFRPRTTAEGDTMPGTLFYVASDSLGVDPDVGTHLMQSFWNSLDEGLDEPVTIAFVNRGIFLALNDSPVESALHRLAARGCRILSCGTCLDFYEARELLGVGEVGSIPVLQALFLGAEKVVSL
jgi:hypothetical protein